MSEPRTWEPSKEDIRLKGKSIELQAIKRCLSTKDGIVLRNYLLRNFCIPSVLDNNPNVTAFKEGQRTLAMQLCGTPFKEDTFAAVLTEALRREEEEQEY
jgi:hypothetical protein